MRYKNIHDLKMVVLFGLKRRVVTKNTKSQVACVFQNHQVVSLNSLSILEQVCELFGDLGLNKWS